MSNNPSATRRSIRRLQLTAAALSAGYGVMFAVMAKIRDTYGISETLLGLIVGVGFFASFAAQILLAPLADRGYARLLLLGGLLTNFFGLMLVSQASSPAPFLIGRTVMGLGVGAAYPALRRSITIIDPENVGRNLGGLNSFDVTGFLLGPAIAALLVGSVGIRWPFAIAAALSLVMLPLTWSAPFGEATGERTRLQASQHGTPRLAIGLLRHDWMQACVLYGVAFFTMIGIFDALWAVRIKDIGGRDWFVTVGIIIFASPMVILGQKGGAFVGRTGPFKTGALGLLAGACLLSLYGLIPIPLLLLGVGVIHATNDGMTAASVPVAVSMCAPTEQQAGAQGLVGAAQTLVGGCSAFAAGWAYEHIGPVATYVGGTIFMVTCVVFGWSLAGEHRHRTLLATNSV